MDPVYCSVGGARGLRPHKYTRTRINIATVPHLNVITVFNMWSLHQYLIINITAGS